MKRVRAGSERGQSIVEFAFIVPVLGLIIFALAEFGFYLNDQVSIVNASRQGARVAAITESAASAQQAVTDSAKSLVSCSNLTSTVSSTQSTIDPGQAAYWTVTASCTYSTVSGSILGFFLQKFGGSGSGQATVSWKTTMRDVNCTPYSQPLACS